MAGNDNEEPNGRLRRIQGFDWLAMTTTTTTSWPARKEDVDNDNDDDEELASKVMMAGHWLLLGYEKITTQQPTCC